MDGARLGHDQTGDGAGDGGLPGSGFTDDADALASIDVEGGVIDGDETLTAFRAMHAGELDRQVVDREHRAHRCTGSESGNRHAAGAAVDGAT